MRPGASCYFHSVARRFSPASRGTLFTFKVLVTAWLIAIGVGGVAAQTKVLSLDHGWTFRQVGTGPWYQADVPGEVHTNLLRQGLIPDPYRDFNVDSVQWVERAEWEYRCTVHADAGLLHHGHVDLVFKGLDTFAEVYLNDSLLGRTDNMFRTWSWPVKKLLKPGANTLHVLFRSTVAEGERLRKAYGIRLPADSDPSGTSPYIRKAAYQFGWDFAPRLVGCGIWKPVELQAWNGSSVTAMRLDQELEADSIRVRVHVGLKGDAATTGFFFLDGLPIGSAMREGDHIGFRFSVHRDRAWWPAGSGPQPMHRLQMEAVDDNGRTVCATERSFGFRTVELRQEEDSIGRSFTFAINGEPILMKGANVVPPDLFPSRAGDSAWVALVRHAQRAHMNMLRVWAGGIYPPDAFFQACDTAGILVWQDVMCANLMPAEGGFLENIRQEVREQGARLSAHPSLALFCGNNELEVAWNNWGWQAKYHLHGTDSARVIANNRALWQQVFPEGLGRTGVPYTWTSPLSNWGNAEGLRNGDLHYWGVWHGDEPIGALAHNVGRFVSEYGFQSWPDSALLAKYIDPEELLLGSGALRWRQRSYKTDAPIWKAIEKELGDRPQTLDGFIDASQAVQAEAYRIAIEAHMGAQPWCMGTLLWQLNDCWPGPSWSLVDYEGNWKPALDVVRRLYE